MKRLVLLSILVFGLLPLSSGCSVSMPEEMKRYGMPEDNIKRHNDPTTKPGSTFAVTYDGYSSVDELFHDTRRSVAAVGGEIVCHRARNPRTRLLFVRHKDELVIMAAIMPEDGAGARIELDLPSPLIDKELESLQRNGMCL